MSPTLDDDDAVARAGRAALSRLRWGASAAPAVQALLFLSLLPMAVDTGRSALPVAVVLVLGSAAGLTALVWWASGRGARVLDDALARLRRMTGLFDALPPGIAVYDAADRLEMCNRSFRATYAPVADLLTHGRAYAELLRAVVARGLVLEAKGREEAWIEERLWQHGREASGGVRETADGRWRRIVEHRLQDGGVLVYSVDVTDLVRRERSSEAAHLEAEAARALLRDAVEALPAAFELFDAEDRLILSNTRLRALYPRIAHLMDDQQRFEDLVRAHRAAGGLDWVGDDFEGWLRHRLQQRRHLPREPRLHRAEGGVWLRLHEQRTSSGGLVCVRIDVTDWVERGHEIERLRAALAAADGARPTTGLLDGLHLTADLAGCGAAAPMDDLPRLRALCLDAVAAAGLQAVGSHFHAFPAPGGITGVVLLAESHLAVHTWPEHAAVTLDVFVCNLERDNRERARRLLADVEAAFAATRVAHRAVERSLPA